MVLKYTKALISLFSAADGDDSSMGNPFSHLIIADQCMTSATGRIFHIRTKQAGNLEPTPIIHGVRY